MNKIALFLLSIAFISCTSKQPPRKKKVKKSVEKHITDTITINNRPIITYNVKHPEITQFVENIMFEYYWQEIKREPSDKYVTPFVKNRYDIEKTDPRVNKKVEEEAIKVLTELGQKLLIDHYALDINSDSTNIIFISK